MHKFQSRPDLVAPIITTELRHRELLSPGYIFLAPYQAEQEGPYIYDNDGNLVWTGFGASGPGSTHAPYVCNYKGSPHICYFQGVQMLGYGWGHGIIMDNNYRFVRSVEAASHQAATDEHEFKVLPDGKTALVTIYERTQYDLTAFGIEKGLGYIQQGVFQEIDIETGKPVFHWESLDHIPPSESFVLPGTTEISGDGYSRQSPWDYFHINSIDKDADGDYLISARHVSGVYKISGKDGSVLWRLGGISSSFDQDFHFSSQHDARFLSKNSTHEVITLFDNASNGFNYTKDFSEGMTIAINHQTKRAQCIQLYKAPDVNGGLMSKSQGNVQILPNGNAVVGWGNNAFFTEFLPNGTAVWHGWIAMTGAMVYRVQKFNWTGIPNTIPALYTYSQDSTDMVFYTSWNGATEVKSWKFYTSRSSDGPYSLEKKVNKNGFETMYHHSTFAPWSYVEALDINDNRLSKSKPQKTYVPSAAMASFCNGFACSEASKPTEEDMQAEKEAQEAEELAKLEMQRAERKRIHAAKIRRKWVLSLNMVGMMMLVIGLVFYCGGKPLRRKLFLLLNDLTQSLGEARDIILRRYGVWKGDYRRVNNDGYHHDGILGNGLTRTGSRGGNGGFPK